MIVSCRSLVMVARFYERAGLVLLLEISRNPPAKPGCGRSFGDDAEEWLEDQHRSGAYEGT